MINNMTLALVCLFIGGVAGYGLRSMNESVGRQAGKTDAGGTKKATGAASASSSMGSNKATSATSSGTSLSDQMKELLADYDVKSAQKAAGKLSADELQSALKLLASMPKSADRDSLRWQLYRAWGALNPDAAWKAALADPLDKNKGYLLSAVAAAVAKTRPAAAIELALSLGMGGRRSAVMSSVFNEWGKVDVAAAIAYSLAHPDLPIDYVSFTTGLSRLAEKEPLKAANLALGFKDEMRRNSLLTSLMSTWVERDAAGALKWAQALENPKQRQDATAAAVGAWAKEDPAAALAYVQGISDVETRTSSFKKAWKDWFVNSPTEAAAYLSSLQDEKLLQSVRFEFSYYSESLTPKERAALLVQIPDGKMKEDIYRTMTDSQIRKGQYNQALEMLNAMPDSRDRDRNVVKLGQEWAKADLAAAGAWLKLQPDSTDRDLAVAGYASSLVRTDPTSALNWANAIPDAKVRDGALKNIAVRWLNSDPAKAEAWIASVPSFTDLDKRMIRDMARMNSDLITMPITVGERR